MARTRAKTNTPKARVKKPILSPCKVAECKGKKVVSPPCTKLRSQNKKGNRTDFGSKRVCLPCT